MDEIGIPIQNWLQTHFTEVVFTLVPGQRYEDVTTHKGAGGGAEWGVVDRIATLVEEGHRGTDGKFRPGKGDEEDAYRTTVSTVGDVEGEGGYYQQWNEGMEIMW